MQITTRGWLAITFIIILILGSVAFLIAENNRKFQNPPKGSHAVSKDSTGFYWYKNNIIYNLDVEVFKDSDGDGTGDFQGLTEKLPYLDSLGIDVLWLAPFQPTPNEDDGYDITDYYSVDPRLGTLDDFKTFMQEAAKRKIRVIIDLVLNHTSDQHPWFQQARRDTLSRYYSWYNWSRKRPSNYDKGMAFPGVQEEIWTYDPVAGRYYYHRFYRFQPDLNLQNPDVRVECLKIIKYWMDLGISGFREDAVPFFIEVPSGKGETFDHQFEIISEMRNFLKVLRPDGIILGEANVMPEENEDFFGKNKDGLQMMFNFYVNQYLFYALATGEVNLLKKALKRTGKYPKQAQWAQFLRNHDEVDLGRLSERQRETVFEKFGPDTNMQLYGRGIRRRLAPMFQNDLKRLKFAYSLLFSLPNTPVIRYGEEIGMGDLLTLKERLAIRTPMQWDDGKNAGFSTALKTVRPVIDTGIYGYRKVNVYQAQKEAHSLLNFLTRIIYLRKSCPEVGYGDWQVLDLSPHVLAIRYDWQGRKLLAIHNFSNKGEKIFLKKDDAGGAVLKDLLSSGKSYANENSQHIISLESYGARWYQAAP